MYFHQVVFSFTPAKQVPAGYYSTHIGAGHIAVTRVKMWSNSQATWRGVVKWSSSNFATTPGLSIDPLHETSRGARSGPHWRTAGAVCYGENVHRSPLPLVCKERSHHFFLQMQYVGLPIACYEISLCWLESRYNDRAKSLFSARQYNFTQTLVFQHGGRWRTIYGVLRTFLVRAMGLYACVTTIHDPRLTSCRLRSR